MRQAALLLALAFMAMEAHCAKRRTCRHYKHFDDYLSHCDFGSLDGGEGGWFTDVQQDDIEGSGSVSDSLIPVTPRPLPYRTGLSKSKKATCCMLGTTAGDKGYHCYVDFYLARIIMRNRNRAHNRKIVFGGDQEIIKSRTKLMKTFEHCVAGRGKIFHKCCHTAAMAIPDYDHYDNQQMMKYKAKMRMKKQK